MSGRGSEGGRGRGRGRWTRRDEGSRSETRASLRNRGRGRRNAGRGARGTHLEIRGDVALGLGVSLVSHRQGEGIGLLPYAEERRHGGVSGGCPLLASTILHETPTRIPTEPPPRWAPRRSTPRTCARSRALSANAVCVGCVALRPRCAHRRVVAELQAEPRASVEALATRRVRRVGIFEAGERAFLLALRADLPSPQPRVMGTDYHAEGVKLLAYVHAPHVFAILPHLARSPPRPRATTRMLTPVFPPPPPS